MKKTVLIVEDEREICLLLQKLLSTDSNSVECAFSLNEGIQKLLSIKPDVVLLDNNLPDGQGVDYIKEFKNGVNRKVIMLSAMHNLREKAISQGVDCFLEKPVNIKTIRNLLY
ncbi:MAG: response regulator [Cytophagales bacterium]|jgi:DNA-binding response OmpR family regulator|nr:response regulator [Cytophagales bacterium]